METVIKPKKIGNKTTGKRTSVKVIPTGDVTNISKFTGNIDKSRFNVK